MSLYSLTHLTGRKRNADRKVIIATIETSKHGFILSVVAILASFVPTALAVAIFGPAAMIIVPPLFVAAALILFKQQSSKGLHLPIYKTLLDKNAAKKVRGKILVCGVPIESHSTLSSLVYSSEPSSPEISKVDLFTPGNGNTLKTVPAYGVAGTHSTRTNEASDIFA